MHRLDLSAYSRPTEFLGMAPEPMLTPREKSPLPEAQRRVEPVILHHTGQRAQHTTDWAFPTPNQFPCLPLNCVCVCFFRNIVQLITWTLSPLDTVTQISTCTQARRHGSLFIDLIHPFNFRQEQNICHIQMVYQTKAMLGLSYKPNHQSRQNKYHT